MTQYTTPTEFKHYILERIVNLKIDTTSPDFLDILQEIFVQTETEKYVVCQVFPGGGWVTRDWLIATYHEIRPDLDLGLLYKADKFTRRIIIFKRLETRARERKEKRQREKILAATANIITNSSQLPRQGRFVMR